MPSFAHALQADVPALSAIARRLCGNPFDADDLVQDTIERALRAGHRYAEQGNRRGWLTTILRNRFRDHCRLARARALPVGELDDLAAPDAAAAAPWEHLTVAHVEAALEQLPARFRRVYELHASGLSYAEIARELGISINTVGTRLVRARNRLRVILVANVC